MSGLEIGSFGRYQIVRKLATGGMAEVFLTRVSGPMGFEKQMVVKRLLPELARDTAFVQMFLAEAKTAAGLNHPNIGQIFDFGEVDGHYFIAMEFIDGPNLRAVIRRARALNVTLPAELCVKMISLACEGLDYVHDFKDPTTGRPLELVHRDISPDNLMLSRNGNLKVLDFGIMRSSNGDSHTRSGALRGKLAYMSPEQVNAEVLDRRSDIWALGMVLYELMAGRRPFDANQDPAMMKAILFEQFRPLNELVPGAPPPLCAIVDRCFQKNRQARYSSCREMQLELEGYLRSSRHEVSAYELSNMILALDQGRAPSAGPSTVPMPRGQLEQELAARAETVRAANEAALRSSAETVRARPVSTSASPEVSPEVATASVEIPGLPRADAGSRGRRSLMVLLGLIVGVAATGVFVSGRLLQGGAEGVDSPLPQTAQGELSADAAIADSVAGAPAAVDAGAEQAVAGPNDAGAPVVVAAGPANRSPSCRPGERGCNGPLLKPRKPTSPASGPPSAEPPKPYAVTLRLLPGGEAFIEGRQVAVGTRFELAAGWHKLRVSNSEFGAVTVEFEVRPCDNVIGYNFVRNKLNQTCNGL